MAIIPISKIIPNPDQPRREFDQDELQSLANSIKKNGLINPIAVEKSGELYILIDGERRIRAAKMAGLKEIEASVRPAMNGSGHQDRLMLAMIANLQRTDLNPIEEAHAYQNMSNMGLTREKIAAIVGISPATVYTRLSLLTFATEIQALWETGHLSSDPRVIAALRRIQDDGERIRLAQGFARRGTSIQFIGILCSRLCNRESKIDNEILDKNDSPAMQLANKRTNSRKGVGQWNALAHIKKAPPWPVIQVTALETCKQCAIADLASESNCRDCPLVDFLKILMSGGN